MENLRPNTHNRSKGIKELKTRETISVPSFQENKQNKDMILSNIINGHENKLDNQTVLVQGIPQQNKSTGKSEAISLRSSGSNVGLSNVVSSRSRRSAQQFVLEPPHIFKSDLKIKNIFINNLKSDQTDLTSPDSKFQGDFKASSNKLYPPLLTKYNVPSSFYQGKEKLNILFNDTILYKINLFST